MEPKRLGSVPFNEREVSGWIRVKVVRQDYVQFEADFIVVTKL